jgi:hypothetical protein
MLPRYNQLDTRQTVRADCGCTNYIDGNIKLCRLHASAPRMLDTLKTIAGFAITSDTNRAELLALCQAMAYQACEEASGR